MILTYLEDNRPHDDYYIVKIPRKLFENDDIIRIIKDDINSYGTNRRGTLIIDEPHKYLNKLYDFYGYYPRDVDVVNANSCTPFEDSASNKNILKYFLMCAFSILSSDEEISSFVEINSEHELNENILNISFKYGRYKYYISHTLLKVIYTISTYSLSENDLKYNFHKIGYEIDNLASKYSRWFSIKYYIPLINRNVPNHYNIDWVSVKNPKEVLSLLTDDEILDTSDIFLILDYDSIVSRYELVNFTYENMKNERFRYIRRDLVVCDRDEIYGNEFLPHDDLDREYYRELTYGIQSSDVENAYIKCINEESLAEYFNSRKGFYAPYNNNKLSSFDINYLARYSKTIELQNAISSVRKLSNKNLINDLYIENNENVIDFIRNLFYSGMYIRRWKGEGYEYPIGHNEASISICSFLRHADPEYLKNAILASPENFEDGIVESIKNDNYNIEVNSNPYLQFSFENYIRGHLEKLGINIETQPELGHLLLDGRSFKDYYTDLMNSEICIRILSQYLILFAWELAKFLSDHIDPSSIIPNFTDDMASSLEHIGNVPRGESENPTM